MRLPAELLSSLRAWDGGGIGSWAVARERSASLPLSADEAQHLAGALQELDSTPAEFERLIALLGAHLGLDYRRRMLVGKTMAPPRLSAWGRAQRTLQPDEAWLTFKDWIERDNR